MEYQKIINLLGNTIETVGKELPKCSTKKRILCHGYTLLTILMMKKLMEVSMKKYCRRQIKQNL